MNSRFLIMLVIALTLAGGAAWIANRWVESQTGGKSAPVAQNTVRVYVASTNIPFATRIEKTHFKLTEWPKDNVPKEAFTEADTAADPNAILGKITQRDFFAGEIMLKPQIKEHLGGSTLSALIQQGMRAVSVRVNDVVGVAGFILPGNKADIITSTDNGDRTFTLLKNVKILAIDQIASTDRDKPAVVRALTLEVTPKQAETLVHAMKNGSLQFTLRNPLDAEVAVEAAEVLPPLSENPPAPVVKRAQPPLTMKVLPWKSQLFIDCTDKSC
jgi:pilus assembly protein CpaB